MAETDPEVRRRRYVAGLCVDCGGCRYSAGRPRCDDCHRKLQLSKFEPGLKRPETPTRKVRIRRRR